MKTVTVHARVSSDLKERAEKIFEQLGLTMSQAIKLFLVASVNKNGIPFKFKNTNDPDKEVEFAVNVGLVDGIEPPERAKNIMRLYAAGEIDYETAQFAIARLFKSNN